MALSRIISEIKRDIGQKSAIFSYFPAFDAPSGRSPSEHCYNAWYKKTRMAWQPDGEKSFMIYLTVLTQYRRVTDGRFDGHLAAA